MKTATTALAIALASLMVLAGPLLDEATDAELQADALNDAQQEARQTADMARWARRACRHEEAATILVQGDEVACLDSNGQRVASIAITKGQP